MATTHNPSTPPGLAMLLDDPSFEITAKDLPALEESAAHIAPESKVGITFLGHETPEARLAAAEATCRLGFLAVPHISARRIPSAASLESFLAALQARGIDRAFVVAGDPPVPEGPYEDALAIITSGLLERHGIRRVGISGYPDGHPDIDRAKLRRAMLDKISALKAAGLEISIFTQFGFDADPVLEWLESLRGDGIEARTRIGISGPAGVKTLLRFAARCGVGTSAKVAAKYGLSITKLLGTAGPDALVRELGERIDPKVHGDVRMHLYPFGGLAKTTQWLSDFRSANGL